MIKLLEDNREALVELCRRFHVKRLEVFGSASRGEDWEAGESDVDLLIELEMQAPAEHLEAYFGFSEAVEQLLGRKVDLVMIEALRNRYFLKNIEPEREVLYAA
jgi:predicted nucleotidyltransferase